MSFTGAMAAADGATGMTEDPLPASAEGMVGLFREACARNCCLSTAPWLTGEQIEQLRQQLVRLGRSHGWAQG
ncbi:hypothetical protein [Streptomyces sp. TE4109]